MALELYKPDEATKSRGGLALLLGSLLLYGVVSLYDYLAMDFWQDDLTKGAMGDEFPVSPRVILCVILMLVTAAGIYVASNHKKGVDFLISTEAEMQKVSWAPKHEVISSSIVVVVTLIILAIYLGLVDYGLVLFSDFSTQVDGKPVPVWPRFWGWVFGG